MIKPRTLMVKHYDFVDFNICLNDVDMSVKKFKRKWNGDFVVVFEIKKDDVNYGESEY